MFPTHIERLKEVVAMAQTHQIRVTDNEKLNRYDVFVDEVLAGFAVYRLAPERIIFVHTEVDDQWEGQGVGSELAKHALDDVRRRGLHMTPVCPFIAAYVRHHPEYADLVDEARRAEF